MFRRIASFSKIAAVSFISCALLSAEDKKPVVTDPAEAGEDFKIQGEYADEVLIKEGSGEKKVRVGVHVRALGDGQFEAIGYQGGLPGAGGLKAEPDKVMGKLENGVVTLKGKDEDTDHWTIKDGVLSAFDKDGSLIAKIKKVERKSDTLGAKPPPGAIVLFDGTNVDAFEGGLLTKDKSLTPDPKKQGAESKKKFQSCTVHVEFRTPYMPRNEGQERGNSGVYLQGRYEVQVLDSFGLTKVETGDCGGIYSVAPPDVNMCFPPLSWQTYDIEFSAAEFDAGRKRTRDAAMTVKHNGVLIHKDRKISSKETTAAIHHEGPEPRGLFLQNHGCPVQYRNIWVLEKK